MSRNRKYKGRQANLKQHISGKGFKAFSLKIFDNALLSFRNRFYVKAKNCIK